MTKELQKQKQVLWISGASTGIGRAVALEAASRGYRLALTARRAELLEKLKQEAIASGALETDILVVPGDVTDINSMQRVSQSISESLGTVDILLANAGGHIPSEGSRFDVAEYRSLFELNFFGVLNCIAAVLPQMEARGKGLVAGVSSVAGYRALPTAAAYGATKSALTYFLESLRFDVEKRGISVTVVSPGFVRTPLTDKNDFPMPCLVEPEYAARVIMDGLEKKSLEIHFPKRFTYFLKFLRLLPQGLYHQLLRRSVAK